MSKRPSKHFIYPGRTEEFQREIFFRRIFYRYRKANEQYKKTIELRDKLRNVTGRYLQAEISSKNARSSVIKQ